MKVGELIDKYADIRASMGTLEQLKRKMDANWEYGRTKSPIEHSNIMEFSEAEEIIKGMQEWGTDVCPETN